MISESQVSSLIPDEIKRDFDYIELSKLADDGWIPDRAPEELNGMDPEIYKLFDSISKVGLVNPITVRPMKDGTYRVVAGKRRSAAYKMLHRRYQTIDPVRFATIPAMVLTEEELLSENIDSAIAMAENMYRKPVKQILLNKTIICRIGVASGLSGNSIQEQFSTGLDVLKIYQSHFVLKTERKKNQICSPEEAERVIFSIVDKTTSSINTALRSINSVLTLDEYITDAVENGNIYADTAIKLAYYLKKHKILGKKLHDDVCALLLEQKNKNEIAQYVTDATSLKNKTKRASYEKKIMRRFDTINKKIKSQTIKEDSGMEISKHLSAIETILNIKGKK